MTNFVEDVSGIAALSDPARRRLYLHVCAQPHAVSREAAANATGMALHKAKFHLDKLEAEGLLDTVYARLTGRTGPGAGRPSKLYQRSQREISVSLPDRAYELAGKLMADAISESMHSKTPVGEALDRAAAAHGRAMGEAMLATVKPTDRKRAFDIALDVLTQNGYEPRQGDGQTTLENCPFHALSRSHTELVCGMNFALIDAMVDVVAPDAVECKLDPRDGRCCVVLRQKSAVPDSE